MMAPVDCDEQCTHNIISKLLKKLYKEVHSKTLQKIIKKKQTTDMYNNLDESPENYAQ